MQIKPVNNRITATKVEEEKPIPSEVLAPNGTELDKYMQVKVIKSSVEEYKRGQILIVPSYADIIKDGKKEIVLVHESDVVAVCE